MHDYWSMPPEWRWSRWPSPAWLTLFGGVVVAVVLLLLTGCGQPKKYADAAAWMEADSVRQAMDVMPDDLLRLNALMGAVCRALPNDSTTRRMQRYGLDDFDVPTMLADADSGGGFQCNDRVKLFVRSATVLGYRARVCPLRRASDGEGHMLAEVWVPDRMRWCVFGLMAEAYYLVDGEPAAAVTLARIAAELVAGVRRDVPVTSSTGGDSFRELVPYLLEIRPARFRMYGDERRAMMFTPATPVFAVTSDSAVVTCDGMRWFIWPQDERPFDEHLYEAW